MATVMNLFWGSVREQNHVVTENLKNSMSARTFAVAEAISRSLPYPHILMGAFLISNIAALYIHLMLTDS